MKFQIQYTKTHNNGIINSPVRQFRIVDLESNTVGVWTNEEDVAELTLPGGYVHYIAITSGFQAFGPSEGELIPDTLYRIIQEHQCEVVNNIPFEYEMEPKDIA